MLRVIRNATFITHSQLVKLALNAGLAPCRQSVHWRLDRYVRTGLVQQVGRVYPHPGQVYTISRAGLSVLESYGEGIFSITSRSERLADAIQAPHFLEINDIRLALESDQTHPIERWFTDREIGSLNYTTDFPYAKDYDGIVQVKRETGEGFHFGFEYERTYKGLDRYAEIAQSISRERQLKFVLYVTASADMVFKLAPILNCNSMPVCFTPSFVIRKQGFNAKIAYLLNGKVTAGLLGDFIAAVIGH